MVSPGSSSLFYRCVTPIDQVEMGVKDAEIEVRLIDNDVEGRRAQQPSVRQVAYGKKTGLTEDL